MLRLIWAGLCLLAAGGPARAADFRKELEAAAAGPALRGASWGVSVRDAGSGKLVAERDGGRLLAPASSLKLFVTAAALSLLGPEHRFRTEVRAGGPPGPDGTLRGGLWLVGGGDPALGSTLVKGNPPMEEVLGSWVRAVKDAGVRGIEGGVVADNLLHPGLPIPGSWPYEDAGNYYAAPADALSIHDNLYALVFAPGSTEGEPARLLRTEPEVPGLRFVNLMLTGPRGSGDNGYVYGGPGQNVATLRGTVPAGPAEFSIKGAIPEPALFAVRALKRALSEAGVAVEGEARLAAPPELSGRPSAVLARTLSPPLKDIVFVTHKRSFNLYAELLARALAVKRGRPGSIGEGLAAVRDFVASAGVDVSGMRLFDACGLSRSNQVTAGQLTGVLVHMAKGKSAETYRLSLVTPGDEDATGHIRGLGKGTALDGNLWTKSGSLGGVRGYSGYLRTRKGRLLAFTFLVNNYASSSADVEKLHERLLLELYGL